MKSKPKLDRSKVSAVILKPAPLGLMPDGRIMLQVKPGSVEEIDGATVTFTAIVRAEDVDEFYLAPAVRLARKQGR